MTLTKTDQDEISQDHARTTYTIPRKIADLNKTDIKAAAISLDTFVTSNLAALNAQLPLPFRTIATPQEKLRLFKLVVQRLELQ